MAPDLIPAGLANYPVLLIRQLMAIVATHQACSLRNAVTSLMTSAPDPVRALPTAADPPTLDPCENKAEAIDPEICHSRA